MPVTSSAFRSGQLRVRTFRKDTPALNNLGTAFAHIIPSFHPVDLLVGIAVGVAMKFIMKMRAANKRSSGKAQSMALLYGVRKRY